MLIEMAGAAIAAPAAAADLCARYAWACHNPPYASGYASVNAEVNGRMQPRRDIGDTWRVGSFGDCEDYALAKLQALGAGRLAHVLTGDGESHVVLLVGDYVLDNLTDEIRRWDETDYHFLRVQDGSGGWRVLNVRAGG